MAITIEALRMAGIKVWMLTGDKVETAKCIAISAGLKATNQGIYEIRGEDEYVSILLMVDFERQIALVFK